MEENTVIFYKDLPDRYFFWKNIDDPNTVLDIYCKNVIEGQKFRGLRTFLKQDIEEMKDIKDVGCYSEDDKFILEDDVECYAVIMIKDIEYVSMCDYSKYDNKDNSRRMFKVETLKDIDCLLKYFPSEKDENSINLCLISKLFGGLHGNIPKKIMDKATTKKRKTVCSMFSDKTEYIFNLGFVSYVSKRTNKRLGPYDRTIKHYDTKGLGKCCRIYKGNIESLFSVFLEFYLFEERYVKSHSVLHEVILKPGRVITYRDILKVDKLEKGMFTDKLFYINSNDEVTIFLKKIKNKKILDAWDESLDDFHVTDFMVECFCSLFGGVETKTDAVLWNMDLIYKFVPVKRVDEN